MQPIKRQYSLKREELQQLLLHRRWTGGLITQLWIHVNYETCNSVWVEFSIKNKSLKWQQQAPFPWYTPKDFYRKSLKFLIFVNHYSLQWIFMFYIYLKKISGLSEKWFYSKLWSGIILQEMRWRRTRHESEESWEEDMPLRSLKRAKCVS